jgi:hypothetical protein
MPTGLLNRTLNARALSFVPASATTVADHGDAGFLASHGLSAWLGWLPRRVSHGGPSLALQRERH